MHVIFNDNSYVYMMKKCLFMNTILFFLFFGCTTHANAWMGNLTQINYHQKVKHNRMPMLFKEIISDNRCPQGAQCVVAGSATVELKIAAKKILLQIGQTIDFAFHRNHYQIKFIDLRPALEKGKKFDKEASFIYLHITEI